MSEYLNIGLDITDLLDNSPTHGKGPALIMCRGIEYMPVKHGHWIKRYEDCDALVCSECGAPSIVAKKYCCECGAKMDGKYQGDKEYEDSILAAQKSEE